MSTCENYDTSNPTILTIEGVYKHGENQALNVSQQVVFRDVVRDGSGNITSQDVIPLQRNHLYKVVLTLKYNLGALEFEKIDYAIQVVDWQNGETIKFTGDANLTHQSTPSFTVRNAVSVSGTESDGVTNPTLLYAGIDDHSIYLIVTSEMTGTMLECPTFPSTQYGLVSSATTNDANGNLVETYKIDIDNNISFATDYTFTLSNAINTSLARTFVLKRRPKLPLEYMAETNLTDRDHFAADNRNSGNYYWGRSTVYAAFNNGGSTTVAETGSKGWHLPSFDEMMAIAPVRSTYYLRWNSNHTNENISETVKIGSETFACTTTYKVVDYTAKIEYVLRYMTTDNKYRSIYRYEAKANPFGTDGGVMMEIKCRYLGPDDTHITNSDIYSEVWWADDSYETLVRYIPASGHTTPDRDWDYNSAYSSGKITWPGQYGYFWIYSSPSYFMDTHPTSGNLDFTINQDSSSALGVPVRLWSDE